METPTLVSVAHEAMTLTASNIRTLQRIADAGGIFAYDTHMGSLAKRGGARKTCCHKLDDMGLVEYVPTRCPIRTAKYAARVAAGEQISLTSLKIFLTAAGALALRAAKEGN